MSVRQAVAGGVLVVEPQSKEDMMLQIVMCGAGLIGVAALLPAALGVGSNH